MSLEELWALTTSAPFGDALQGPHPTIDGWVLPKSAVALMDEGGYNVDSILLGGVRTSNLPQLSIIFWTISDTLLAIDLL